MIRPLPHVERMAAYQLAQLSVPEGKRLISLSQNESLRPPSPHVRQALAELASGAQLYPDPDWSALRAAIADLHGIDAGQILCGNGSLDLIGAIARAYLGPGDAALAPAHAYPFFRTATQVTGARFDTADETGMTADVDRLLAAITPETRLLFLANPGNPTGTRLPRAEILRLRDQLPEHVLLILDEAYGEFADHLGEPMFDLVAGGNAVILRTFSKAYGLAGMRVGWGLFPGDMAQQIRKLLNPNNVALAGQKAAAAALADQAYMRETCAVTADIRDRFIARLRGLGFPVLDSFSNFAVIGFANAAEAASADAALRAEGVFPRGQAGAGLPACLRATIGVANDMDYAADVLEAWRNGERLT